ncbi:hypothetical protein C8Q72DRAFT_85652 [Fomitopsis betulina]|nr:hypothetical protein C8Q72DRAFT_85652 [Fomitopsis betulina]
MVFYGGPLPEPFVPACFGMRRLRSLSLKINPGLEDMMPPMVFPAGSKSTSPPTFPWPELERLLVSYPDPRDGIYDCLPSTLRSLSLRCWSHQHRQYEMNHSGGNMCGSLILSILRRCSMLRLNHLEIEYYADNDENDPVLQYLAVTFPYLESLKIYRYRSYMMEEAPVVYISQAPPSQNLPGLVQSDDRSFNR